MCHINPVSLESLSFNRNKTRTSSLSKYKLSLLCLTSKKRICVHVGSKSEDIENDKRQDDIYSGKSPKWMVYSGKSHEN